MNSLFIILFIKLLSLTPLLWCSRTVLLYREWREEATLQDDNAGAVYAQFGTSVCLANDATLLAVGTYMCIYILSYYHINMHILR